jgi:fatty acid-binding protein DegV
MNVKTIGIVSLGILAGGGIAFVVNQYRKKKYVKEGIAIIAKMTGEDAASIETELNRLVKEEKEMEKAGASKEAIDERTTNFAKQLFREQCI